MPQIKTSILMGYECNNNCRFCYAGDKRNKYRSDTTQRIKEKLERARERGSRFVDFLGGEPTIRKDIFEIVSYAKEIGFKTISITTNGRMMSYEDFTKKLVDAGLNSAIFSIHGHNAELHDYLTRSPGSFDQLCKGMKNFREAAPDGYICTNTVMVRPNLKHLPEIAENNIKLGTDGAEFIFPHPRGNAWKNFEEMVPRLEELLPYIRKTLFVGIQHDKKHFVVRYVPLCYLLGLENMLSEFKSKNRLHEEHIGPEFEDLDVEKGRAEFGRVKAPQCFGCKYFRVCEGIFKEYAEKRGFDELIPVP
jgi:MoaA/NifB/PqqE/SkfB family radical SAM enzyme